MTVLFYIAIFLFLLMSVLLCLVILIQESKSMGLGASFGGDPGDSLLELQLLQSLRSLPLF